MKKLTALMLAGVLALSLAVPAFAAEDGAMEPFPDTGEELLIAPAPLPEGERYAAILTVNGETVDTAHLPKSEGIPLRALAESDHSSAYWDEESATGYGYLEGYTIGVNVDTLAITLNSEPVEGMTAWEIGGHTFIPVALLDSLEGYTVTHSVENAVDRYDVITPNNAPLIKLGYSVVEVSQARCFGKMDIGPMIQNLGIPAESFEEGYNFVGMSLAPDTLFLAKLSPTADEEAIRAAFDQYTESQKQTFSWYGNVEENTPKLERAHVEINGGYMMYLIAARDDLGIEAFNAFVAARQAE